jgi:hypothetical protein
MRINVGDRVKFAFELNPNSWFVVTGNARFFNPDSREMVIGQLRFHSIPGTFAAAHNIPKTLEVPSEALTRV